MASLGEFNAAKYDKVVDEMGYSPFFKRAIEFGVETPLTCRDV